MRATTLSPCPACTESLRSVLFLALPQACNAIPSPVTAAQCQITLLATAPFLAGCLAATLSGFACLSVCLHVYTLAFPVCLPACLPGSLSAHPHGFLSIHLHDCVMISWVLLHAMMCITTCITLPPAGHMTGNLL